MYHPQQGGQRGRGGGGQRSARRGAAVEVPSNIRISGVAFSCETIQRTKSGPLKLATAQNRPSPPTPSQRCPPCTCVCRVGPFSQQGPRGTPRPMPLPWTRAKPLACPHRCHTNPELQVMTDDGQPPAEMGKVIDSVWWVQHHHGPFANRQPLAKPFLRGSPSAQRPPTSPSLIAPPCSFCTQMVMSISPPKKGRRQCPSRPRPVDNDRRQDPRPVYPQHICLSRLQTGSPSATARAELWQHYGRHKTTEFAPFIPAPSHSTNSSFTPRMAHTCTASTVWTSRVGCTASASANRRTGAPPKPEPKAPLTP